MKRDVTNGVQHILWLSGNCGLQCSHTKWSLTSECVARRSTSVDGGGSVVTTREDSVFLPDLCPFQCLVRQGLTEGDA